MIRDGKPIGADRDQGQRGSVTYDIEKRIAASGDRSDQLSVQCTVFLLFEALSAAQDSMLEVQY